MSWKTFMILAIGAWGLWSFLGKMVMAQIGWGSAIVLQGIVSLLLVLLLKPQSFHLSLEPSIWLALLMSILGGFGTIFFYRALEGGPASVVVPGTALYIVIAAILAFIFLGETITWNRIAGLGCGLMAIYLLSRG